MSKFSEIVKGIEDFISDEDKNVAGLEIKKKTPTMVVICIGETFDMNLSMDNGKIKFSSGEEVLGELVIKMNKYCESNPTAKIDQILDEFSVLWAEDDDDDEDEEGEDECETPLDPSLLDFEDPFSVGEIQKTGKKSKFEELEELKQKFDLQGTNKAAVQRLLKDLNDLSLEVTSKSGFFAQPKGRDLFDWEVKCFNFEKDDPKSDLAKDFKQYKKKFGIDYVLFSMKFPPEYPFSPPFIRVIKPRMKYLTGHITIGGSICMQLLTKSGWMPANSIESIFIQIRLAMMQGGCRIDFGNTSKYSEHEAKEAFYRVARRYGWEK